MRWRDTMACGLVPWVVACGAVEIDGPPAGDLGTSSAGDDGVSSDPPPPRCGAGSGFVREPVPVQVPFDAPQIDDGGERVGWQLRDVNGDRLPDLALLGDGSSSASEVRVFLQVDGGAFADAPIIWPIDLAGSLPPARIVDNDRGWAMVDLNGDDHLDLVNAVGLDPVGASTWEVFRGDAGELAAIPSGWSIPFATGPAMADPGDTASWALLDLDGNGILDMVARSGSQADGARAWSWWPGSAVGFSPFERAWRIPRPLGAVVDRGDAPTFVVRDVDGDRTADLLTLDEHRADRLRLYRGGLEGFSTVPSALVMPWAIDAVDDRGPVPTWTLIDVDGDRRLDLVSARPDPVLGAPAGATSDDGAWWVYFGVADHGAALGDTFLETPVAWSTPAPFDRVRDGGTLVRWRALDFNGDGVLDLVTSTPDDPRTWRIHRGICTASERTDPR